MPSQSDTCTWATRFLRRRAKSAGEMRISQKCEMSTVAFTLTSPISSRKRSIASSELMNANSKGISSIASSILVSGTNWGQIKDHHARTQVSGVTGVQEEGPKSALNSKDRYPRKALSMNNRLTRGCFAGEGDVGEASRFASSVRTDQRADFSFPTTAESRAARAML